MDTRPAPYLLGDEQSAVRDEARRFFIDTFRPLERRMDEEAWMPEEAFRQLGSMGYLGLTVPERYGGSGLDYLSAGLVTEALAEANPSLAFSAFAHQNLCLDNIARNATPEQREYFVPRLCSGEHSRCRCRQHVGSSRRANRRCRPGPSPPGWPAVR